MRARETMNVKKTSLEVSRRMKALEDKLSKQLLSFYNNKINPLGAYPVEFARRQFESEIKIMIRMAVQDSYLYGTSVVGSAITDVNDKFQVFISVRDVQNISTLTNTLNNRFWNTVGKLLTRKQEVEAFTPDELRAIPNIVKKESFNVVAAMVTVAGSIAWKTYNNSVVDKLMQLTNIDELINRIPALLSTGQQNRLETGIQYDFFRVVETPTDFAAKLMFLTAEDAKVDPDICEPLNRLVFDINRDTGALSEAGIQTLEEEGLSFVP